MATETLHSSTEPWLSQQPYLERGFDAAGNLLATGGPDYYGGSTVAPLSGTTQDALSQYLRIANAGNPITAPTQGMIADTLSGQYLDPATNPYLQATSDMAGRQMGRQYSEAVAPGIGAGFDAAGRYGSGLYQNQMDISRAALAQGLGDINTTIYGGAYNNERDRMLQAAQLAPEIAPMSYLDAAQMLNVGELYDTQAQKELSADIQRHQFNQEQPYDALSRYMASIGGGSYGSSSNEDYSTPSTLQNLAGGTMAGLGFLQSMGGLGGIGDLFSF